MKTKEECYKVYEDHSKALAYAIIDDIDNKDYFYEDLLDRVELLIRTHMEEYPGNWQNWIFEKRAKKMLAMMRKINKANDWTDSRANLINRYG